MKTNYTYQPERKRTTTRRGQGGGLKIGRTIAQEWEKQESESERLAARKKNKTRKWLSVSTFLVFVGLIAVIGLAVTSQMVSTKEEVTEAEFRHPSIEVIDEANIGISRRMKEYVGQVELDLKDLGYVATKAVVPAGKTREVDVYIFGIDGYFKLNLDRGTAVSAEDVVRMLKYLEEREIQFEYVDVRVEGKGYYKGRD